MHHFGEESNREFVMTLTGIYWVKKAKILSVAFGTLQML